MFCCLPSVLAASAAGVCQACKDPRFKKKNMAGARVQRGTVSEAINIVGAQQDPITTAVGVVRAAQHAYAVEQPAADGADL